MVNKIPTFVGILLQHTVARESKDGAARAQARQSGESGVDSVMKNELQNQVQSSGATFYNVAIYRCIVD